MPPSGPLIPTLYYDAIHITQRDEQHRNVPRPLFYYYPWTHRDVGQTGSDLNRVATVEAVFIVYRFCSIFLLAYHIILECPLSDLKSTITETGMGVTSRP